MLIPELNQNQKHLLISVIKASTVLFLKSLCVKVWGQEQGGLQVLLHRSIQKKRNEHLKTPKIQRNPFLSPALHVQLLFFNPLPH